MTWWLLSLLGFWVGLNWLAPYAAIYRAERISPGRLPHELFSLDGARRVRFYVDDLTTGLGYSIWAPPLHCVVFDRNFFAQASPPIVRFVVAHELAHFSMKHHQLRWFSVVLGLILLPAVRRRLVRAEDEADAEAERRTGYPRSILGHPQPERKQRHEDLRSTSRPGTDAVPTRHDGVLHQDPAPPRR